ncbi:tetratricopeptide repeat protein [Oceanospirillum sp.]|uniref:tetratricopeptide repeat protein n=1 Tax=Oceanospirillum sp. TaxID=2021254 RepID=UPI003A902F92
MQGMPALISSSRLTRASILLSLLWLSGCQQQITQPDALTLSPKDLRSEAQITSPQVQQPISGLDGEAIQDLLAAEIAGQRNQVGFALQLYLEQAARLQNPELARRATYIAQYAGDNQTTLDAAALWSETAPDNAEPRRISSTLLIQQGDVLGAFDFQSELLSMGEETHFSYLAAQSAEADEYTRNELLSAINSLHDHHPDNPDLLTAIAQLLYFSGHNQRANEVIDISLGVAPLSIRSILLKADLAITQHDLRAGIHILEQAILKQPDNLRLQLALARTLVKDGDIDQAQQVFSKIASSHPENGQLTLSLALILMENGLPEQARNQLNKLLERGFEIDAAHYYLGRLEEQENNVQAATDHYRMVKGGKDFLQAQARAAQLLIAQGENDEARAHLATLRLTSPEYRVRLYLLESELLLAQNKLDDAHQLLTEAILSEGSDYELLYSRAMISLKEQDIPSLERDLREILDNEPNNAMVLNTLGYTLTEYTDRYSEALLLIRKAAALKPGDPAITDSLGWVYFKLGQLNEATRFLQQAYNQLQDPEIASHLIEVYWVSGQQDEAVDLLLEARQLFRDSLLLDAVEKRFPELSTQAIHQESEYPTENPEETADTRPAE